MSDAGLDRPVVVLGAARSGTTLAGELLARHPRVGYWVEPKYVWQYRKPGAADDVRTAAEATPAVRGYIRDRFARFLEETGRDRFAEKTPSNCFRVPFVDAVLPDARYLHLVRDGRDVVFSAMGKWTSPPAGDAVLRRLTSFEIPLRDLPIYGARALGRLARNPWTRSEWALWGPRYPGMAEDRERLPLLELCATQWARSVAALRHGLDQVPGARVTTVRFEELVTRPRETLARALEGVELEPLPEVLDHADAVTRADRARSWRERDPDLLERVTAVIGDELEALGYG